MAKSRSVVIVSLISNLTVATSKFVVAAITGSSSMLAEALHSLVDTGNSLMLWLGVKRSRRPADQHHPFGHGKELYFWSFVVAVSMFSVGGGVSVYEGILRIRRPEPPSNLLWSYVVIGVGVASTVASLVVALRKMRQRNSKTRILEFIRKSKDPAVFTVIVEEIGDLLGLGIATVAITLSYTLHRPIFDGAGSIAIGLVMIGLSGILANDSRKLLVGEAADSKQVEQIRRIVEQDPGVKKVGQLLTMQLGPREILVNVEIQLEPQGSLDRLEQTIDRIERNIRSKNHAVRQVFLEATSLHTAEQKFSPPSRTG